MNIFKTVAEYRFDKWNC